MTGFPVIHGPVLWDVSSGAFRDSEWPLGGLRVLDLTSWLGGYSGRLLSDLGADVISFVSKEEPAGFAERELFNRLGKVVQRTDGAAVTLDDIRPLLDEAHVLITDAAPDELAKRGLDPGELQSRWSRLVHVAISPHGLSGPKRNDQATDLTLLAEGGLLYLAGDSDRAPVRPYGEQSAVATSLHAVVAALMAVLVQDRDGVGQVVDVSAHEAVAHSIENAVQVLDCEADVRRRRGSGPREAGVGLFECADGYVYILTSMGGRSLNWEALVQWLIDSGVPGADRLAGADWSDADHRRSTGACDYFAEVFGRFVGNMSKHDVVAQGQQRAISIAPVQSPEDLLQSRHLVDRRFFQRVDTPMGAIAVPGVPYRFLNANVGRFPEPSPAAVVVEAKG